MNRISKNLLMFIFICLVFLFGMVWALLSQKSIIEVKGSIEQIDKRLNWLENTPEEYKEAVLSLSDKYGLNPMWVDRIVFCESTWNAKAKNPNSTAKGFFQFIDGTWKWTLKRMGLDTTISQYDKLTNLEAGIFLLSKGETSHWNESANCWRTYAIKEIN